MRTKTVCVCGGCEQELCGGERGREGENKNCVGDRVKDTSQRLLLWFM